MSKVISKTEKETKQQFTKMHEVKEKKPYILMENNVGVHNSDLEATRSRLLKGISYKDTSTIIIVPTRGMIPAPWVQAYTQLIKPMNSRITTLFCSGDEVSISYNNAINMILNNETLKSWKYVLTYEDDVIPPPDGLLKLYEHIGDYDVLGGLYFLKGEGGSAQIFGRTDEYPKNYLPQVPMIDAIQPCWAMGMGFNLYKMSCFTRMKGPEWFKTVQEWNPQTGGAQMTQDIYFYENGSKLGFKYACDTSVRCAHYDHENNIYW